MSENIKENPEGPSWRTKEWYQPRGFALYRREDVTGVSGTGIVAVGAVLPTGWVALTWLTEHTSLVWYESIEKVIKIHCHHGASSIVWTASDQFGDLFRT